MENQVTITANPTTGNVFTENTNLGKDGKAYGFIRVESQWVDFSGAVAKVKSRSALKTISKEDYLKAASFLTAGSKLPGKIIVKDTLAPAYEGHAPLSVPVTAGSKEMRIVTSNGQPVYRQNIFTSDANAQDEKVSYDKVGIAATVNALNA